ncbi:MAG: cyclic nucleotide-binding domain-containing protein [Chloroflexi bacterium]|nr:cyclic nucleotide-binding domain-containing protein [Chloroflexota bacterium]
MIVRQGQARSHLFIVASGKLAVAQMVGDGEQYGVFGARSIWRKYALFADVPYSATLRAVRRNYICSMKPTFDRLVAEYKGVSH